jgi:hypothetical protein
VLADLTVQRAVLANAKSEADELQRAIETMHRGRPQGSLRHATRIALLAELPGDGLLDHPERSDGRRCRHLGGAPVWR